MEVIHTAPDPSSFIPLSQHQSQTPASFYSGPPVLHYQNRRCKIRILEGDLTKASALAALATGTSATTNGDSVHGNGEHEGDVERGQEIVFEDVDVWVTSALLLYSSSTSKGVSVPYPSISLHAIQRLPPPGLEPSVPDGADQQGLYMQLVTSSIPTDEDDDEELDTISLTIVSPPPDHPQQLAATATTLDSGNEEADLAPQDAVAETPTQSLFNALSACSNLHPDTVADSSSNLQGSSLFEAGLIQAGDNEGGLPPPVEGSTTGWITAENGGDFFDEEGNWLGDGEGLGPGAGTTRARDEEEHDEGVDGEDGEEGETKWRRTS